MAGDWGFKFDEDLDLPRSIFLSTLFSPSLSFFFLGESGFVGVLSLAFFKILFFFVIRFSFEGLDLMLLLIWLTGEREDFSWFKGWILRVEAIKLLIGVFYCLFFFFSGLSRDFTFVSFPISKSSMSLKTWKLIWGVSYFFTSNS